MTTVETKTFSINYRGNDYTVMVTKHYITIAQKRARGVWGSLGKTFYSFKEAIANYKSPQMKAQLIQIESMCN